MIQITNTEFLTALFKDDAPWVHVTDFEYDPNNIPPERHLSAWKGDYFSRYRMGENTNQYFTISNFYADPQGVARRRKVLYRHTPVIVLDDVKEKLSMDEVTKLPDPAWILETSPGSEQWGYILNEPCTERSRVENLLDGLVANGLAPEGRDPGMKGVTRYVRLPEGINNKASKLVNGQPFKCQMLTWAPFNTTTLEDLAAPFVVNLDAPRRESRIDGAADVSDHPLLNIPDLVRIKEVRSEGRFDITCPWVEEHTGADDSGTAIFTNGDGSMGFKCHHGNCQEKTGKDLMQFIEEEQPGFGDGYRQWQTIRIFADTPDAAAAPPATVPPVSFINPPTAPVVEPEVTFESAMAKFTHMGHTLAETREYAAKLLRLIETLAPIERAPHRETVRLHMHWGKGELNSILKDLRSSWYMDKSAAIDFFSDVIWVGGLNQFFDRKRQIFYSPDGYQNTYSHLSPEARKEALEGNMVTKVNMIDYAPLSPSVFERDHIIYGNSWDNSTEVHGQPGDISNYLRHFEELGWKENRKHLMQWMAYTIKHPDKKINHMIILGSGEGCGKDWLLFPLVKAMGRNHKTIAGEELLRDFDDYALSTKHLHINEAELGDRREAIAISNKLKPLAAAPPDKNRVNQKGVKPIEITNIISCSMTTNSQLPIRLNGASRRFYAVWSDLNIRDFDDNVKPEWLTYWDDQWNWMRGGGAEAVIYHLRNNVDLSDFNPQASPPMTQFLRDIREASKSPMTQTVEEFIRHRFGIFNCDMMTSTDISETIRAGALTEEGLKLLLCDARLFTPTRVGMIMKEISGINCRRAQKGKSTLRLWVVRNAEKYMNMGSSEVHDEYDRQLKMTRSKVSMTVVK